MKVRDQWENIDVEGKTLLKCTLKQWGMSVWTVFNWLRVGNVRLLFICRFHQRLHNYQVDNNDSDA
jgi:hypothetical protein